MPRAGKPAEGHPPDAPIAAPPAQATPPAPRSAAERFNFVLAELEALPVEALEFIAGKLSPSALRRRREDERDDRIRDLALDFGLFASNASVRAIAGGVATALQRYAASAWRRGETPADRRRALLHRVLELNHGPARGLSSSSIGRALAGLSAPRAVSQKQPSK